MADKPINQITPTGTDISDDAYMVIDEDLGGAGYETRKVKWSSVLLNAIRGYSWLCKISFKQHLDRHKPIQQAG